MRSGLLRERLNKKKGLFFALDRYFFNEKCISYQNFPYFCTRIIYLLLRDRQKPILYFVL